jgi:hypothetical protein
VSGGGLYAAGGSAAAGLASGLSWIWKLGPVQSEPDPSACGIGSIEEATVLSELVGSGRLASAVILAGEGGPASGPVPARRRVSGIPKFSGGTRVRGEFTLFDSGEAAVASSLGTHAVDAGDVLIVGIDPDRDWGRLDAFWAYESISAHLGRTIARPVVRLPPIGCLRLDDTPGTAQHQMEGRAKGDAKQSRRIRALAANLRNERAVLNVAVCAEALEERRRVPLDQVWPASVDALREGIEMGAYETILHGLLHLNPESLERGEVEYTEFARLDAATAGEHLDKALDWQSRKLSRPTVFVAPAWAYGPAADAEGAERGLVRWYRARPGPLLDGGRFYETLIGELLGLYKLDYSPLVRLATLGIPPVIAMHGALLDGRLARLKANRELVLLARLLLKRDVNRLAGLDGIRWVGAGDLIGQIAAHTGTERLGAAAW